MQKNIQNGVAKPKTRDELVAQVAVLDELIKVVAREDEDRRRDLSEMLGSIDFYKGEYGSRTERSVKVLSWNGIIFNIGELKAAADFSILLERERNKDKEIADLLARISVLEHPEKHKHNECQCKECIRAREWRP